MLAAYTIVAVAKGLDANHRKADGKKELSTLNLSDEYQRSLVAKHVPKHCGKSAHEDELNQGECKNLDRNGIKRIFHTDSMQCGMKPLLCNAFIATPYQGLTLLSFSIPAGRTAVMTPRTGLLQL